MFYYLFSLKDSLEYRGFYPKLTNTKIKCNYIDRLKVLNLKVEDNFSKHANDYDDNNIIQRIVSRALVRELTAKPKKILELGCGSGQVFRQIDWEIEKYVAIDFASLMCDIHPKGNNIEVYQFDFDSSAFEHFLQNKKFDMVLSSSAMQWSKNIDKLLTNIFKVTNHFEGVLFTSNTFKSIYEITQEPSKILSLEDIKKAFEPYGATFEVFEYKLNFESKKELFAYIKNSGVQGDGKLPFVKAKKLYQTYPHLYLEFEVVFVKVNSSKKRV